MIKMKKNDLICLVLSIAINVAIIFALTVYKKDESLTQADEIKIGLVAMETGASTQFKAEKNADAQEQNLDATSIEKKGEQAETEKEIDEKEVTNEKKIEEQPKEEKQISKEEKTIEIEKKGEKKKEEKKEIEKITKEEKVEKKKPSLADLKKQISQSKPKIAGNPNGGYSPSSETEEVVDRVLKNVNYSNGLVSGSKMGTSEKGYLVNWSDRNRKPEFPQSARQSGKHGKIRVQLKVDKMGNVLSYSIVNGSGVPEIDAAVERVMGSWRVELLKGGKAVNGTFYLDYNFDFK